MKSKIVLLSVVLAVITALGVVSVKTASNFYAADELTTSVKAVADNPAKADSCCEKDCKDCCGMPDCCKDGKCAMGGTCCASCCKEADHCPLKKKEKQVSQNDGKDCCQSGASCCNGGACCKKSA